MTSVVRVYRSTDSSAPVLTGQNGKLTDLLDAVLVNGYGSQTAAGWTIAQTTTNKRGYRNSATDGTGFHVWIDDAGPGAGAAKEARATGFETMSGLGTGTGQFPAVGQAVTSTTPNQCLVIRKSSTADATARAWTIVADNTVFYLFVESGDLTAPLAAFPFVFGDFFSYKTSDAYRCIIIGRTIENTFSTANEVLSTLLAPSTALILGTVMTGHFVARAYAGVGSSKNVGKHTDQTAIHPTSLFASGTGSGIGIQYNVQPNMRFPNGPDGGLYVAPIWLHEDYTRRGYLKGLWAPLQDRPLNHNDSYTGTGAMTGKTLICQQIPVAASGANITTIVGQVHIETSNTWS